MKALEEQKAIEALQQAGENNKQGKDNSKKRKAQFICSSKKTTSAKKNKIVTKLKEKVNHIEVGLSLLTTSASEAMNDDSNEVESIDRTTDASESLKDNIDQETAASKGNSPFLSFVSYLWKLMFLGLYYPSMNRENNQRKKPTTKEEVLVNKFTGNMNYLLTAKDSPIGKNDILLSIIDIISIIKLYLLLHYSCNFSRRFPTIEVCK